MNIVDSSLWVEYFLDAELYTQDKHFENLDRVHYFLK